MREEGISNKMLYKNKGQMIKGKIQNQIDTLISKGYRNERGNWEEIQENRKWEN